MTTKNSPLRVLKAQADKIAALLKAAERGEKIDVQFATKIDEARAKENVKFGVFMDDKIFIVDMPWDRIRNSTEIELSEWILNQMREVRETVQ